MEGKGRGGSLTPLCPLLASSSFLDPPSLGLPANPEKKISLFLEIPLLFPTGLLRTTTKAKAKPGYHPSPLQVSHPKGNTTQQHNQPLEEEERSPAPRSSQLLFFFFALPSSPRAKKSIRSRERWRWFKKESCCPAEVLIRNEPARSCSLSAPIICPLVGCRQRGSAQSGMATCRFLYRCPII